MGKVAILGATMALAAAIFAGGAQAATYRAVDYQPQCLAGENINQLVADHGGNVMRVGISSSNADQPLV
jgi:hypothetical protein